ncbi:MAG: hypothetical protein IH874_05215 [Candidatus Dadabacteria bacterium]|nr:hypothetical protein [Candidatus Dadabacteria bacterium]
MTEEKSAEESAEEQKTEEAAEETIEQQRLAKNQSPPVSTGFPTWKRAQATNRRSS